LPALASPAYRVFLAGAFVTNVGGWMQTTALGWLVLRLTDSPALLGLASFAGSAPTLLLVLYAGVLADRVDRRRLLLGAQLVIGGLAALLALLATSGHVAFWQIALIAFAAGSAQAMAMPTFQSMLPALVGREALGNAIVLNSAQFNLSRIVGPAIAGVIVGAVGESTNFWLNAIGTTAFVLALRSIRLPAQETLVRAEAGLWSNLLDGLRYVAGQRPLLALLVLAGAPALFVLPYLTLMPVFARDVLGIGATGLGLLTAAIGVGALVGALTMAVSRPAGANARTMIVGLVSMAVTLAVFSSSRNVALSCLSLAGLGASQVAYYTTTNTLVQLLSPARFRGRILSVYVLMSLGLLPLGSIAAGIAAQAIGAPQVLLIGAAATVVALAAILVRNPALWRLRIDPAATPGR
jgi:MFS family permease